MNNKLLHSDLKKARNLGSAKHGISHWWYQRFSAILLVPLTIWVIFFGIKIHDATIQEIHHLLKKPYHFLCLALFIIFALYHAMLGMQVIVEDYVSCMKARLFILILLKIFSLITIVATIVALCFFVLV